MKRDKLIFVAPTYAFIKRVAPEEKEDPIKTALGVSIDVATVQYNYRYISKKTSSILRSVVRYATKVFDCELKKRGITLSVKDRALYLDRILKMLTCWSKSKYVKLQRPKSHVILIERDGRIRGVYAKPDFKNGIFYELKSYDIEREWQLHVEKQAKVFSLLGRLKLLYFVEKDGEFIIAEKEVSRDLSILDELWKFLKEESEEVGEWKSLDNLMFNYPTVFYRFEGKKWFMCVEGSPSSTLPLSFL